ncbi:MAG: hypothetical protein ACTSR2_07010 [Candidatus Hodarchaeales archaeon]
MRINKERTTKIKNSDGSISIVNFKQSERMASNEDFGKYGWQFDSLESAEKKFEQLINDN